MAATNSLNMDTSGVQTYNATTGGLDGSATTQYNVVCGDANNKIQCLASTGSSTQVLTSNGAGVLPSFQAFTGGGGSVITVTKFTANGTWTKAANSQYVYFVIWNGGGGGGSGRRGASASAGGGAGGAFGGGLLWGTFSSQFASSESVTVGGGGGGGNAQTSDNTNGNPGSVGGQSYVKDTSIGYITASSNGGAGGTSTTAVGQSAQEFNQMIPEMYSFSVTNTIQGGAGSNSAGSAPAGGYSDQYNYVGGAGGGGGGGNTTTERAGAAGEGVWSLGSSAVSILAAGSGGTESGTINGGNGTNNTSLRISGGAGGGGGGGQKSGGSAGTGGTGGYPGGGGGGGGGSINGTNSGAGGTGGRGEVWIIEYS